MKNEGVQWKLCIFKKNCELILLNFEKYGIDKRNINENKSLVCLKAALSSFPSYLAFLAVEGEM